MNTHSYNFIKGMLIGSIGALLIGGLFIYTLNVLGYAVIQFPLNSGLNKIINFTYQNLKLSIIPFTAVLIGYAHLLNKLCHQLNSKQSSLDQIAQTDHLIDSTVSLFFGIGVIWTAIGMRSALMFALGDPETAAAEGAFAILQRMVDGGILLALSTTIFGGIGGYTMRIIKTVYLGQQLQSYYNQEIQKQSVDAYDILKRIEQHIQLLTKPEVKL